jgi:hypothetical protein
LIGLGGCIFKNKNCQKKRVQKQPKTGKKLKKKDVKDEKKN